MEIAHAPITDDELHIFFSDEIELDITDVEIIAPPSVWGRWAA